VIERQSLSLARPRPFWGLIETGFEPGYSEHIRFCYLYLDYRTGPPAHQQSMLGLAATGVYGFKILKLKPEESSQ
jgi:hypothetical protein